MTTNVQHPILRQIAAQRLANWTRLVSEKEDELSRASGELDVARQTTNTFKRILNMHTTKLNLALERALAMRLDTIDACATDLPHESWIKNSIREASSDIQKWDHQWREAKQAFEIKQYELITITEALRLLQEKQAHFQHTLG